MSKSSHHLLLLILACLSFLSSLHAQQTIAKLKVAPVYTGKGATPDKKAAELATALQSIDSLITAFNKGAKGEALQNSLTKFSNIQQKVADTIFNSHVTRLPAINYPKAGDSIPLIIWTLSPAFDTAKSINLLLQSYKKDTSDVTLIQIAKKFKSSPQVLHLPHADSINNIINLRLGRAPSPNDRPLQLDTIALKNVTVITDASTPAQPDLGNAKCVKQDSIANFKCDKGADGSWQFTFLDANDNPVAGFNLEQLTEPSFNDKMAKAIFGLCTASLTAADSAAGDTIIARFQKQKVYQSILEDAVASTNSQDLAGKLSISKHLHVYRDHVSPDTTKKPADTVNKSNPKSANGNAVIGTSLGSVNMLLPTIIWSKMLDTPGKGSLDLNKSGTVSKDPKQNYDTLPFTVFSIQIQFQDGFIENIKVHGKIKGDSSLLKFENTMPIAFSTKREFSRFDLICLYEKTKYRKLRYHLVLGNLISYSENFELNNKDYSPQNQVYTNNNVTDSMTVVNLYKEQTSQILQARVFTDLKGLNSANPNGLVQTELSKKLNFWSHRVPLFTNLMNLGFVNYVTPMFSLNKIESNQKYLTLNSIDSVASVNDPGSAMTYASTIQLLNHQQFKVGFDLSALLLDVPAIKSEFNLGMTAYFGSTPIQDTLRTDTATGNRIARFIPSASNNVQNYDVNTFQWGPYISWQIFPNPRYGFIATYSLFSFKSLSSRFVQVRDSANFVNYISSHARDAYPLYTRNKSFESWVNAIEIFAFYEPSQNSQLFFRYRLYKDMNNGKENFRQLQLGITTYLTTTKQSKDAKGNTATTTQ